MTKTAIWVHLMFGGVIVKTVMWALGFGFDPAGLIDGAFWMGFTLFFCHLYEGKA